MSCYGCGNVFWRSDELLRSIKKSQKSLGCAIPEHQVWFNSALSLLAGRAMKSIRGCNAKVLDYESELGLLLVKPPKM